MKLSMPKVITVFFLFFISCSPTQANDLVTSESTEKGEFNLPPYNGQCFYSEEEALSELEKLKGESNLDFDIKVIYKTGPVDCVGRVWGSNLAQGAKIDKDTNSVDLIVGKEDLNNLSREKQLPSEYGRTIDLGPVKASLFKDFTMYGDYITDIDYFSEIESYLYVGHQKSIIYISSEDSPDPLPLIDLTRYVGTTENWETGLISIDPIKFEDNKIYFLASYTDKDISLSISVFDFDLETGLIDKEEELFLSPQNGGEDIHHCGNIERINSNTWIFCVGDQDTLYALNENSLRTDLYSGKLVMFSMDDDFNVYPAITPTYNPEIFTPVGGDVRPKAVLASPPIRSSFEIEHILALGFRNPWGFAVDDDYIFVPDVGHNKVEEVNLIDLNSLEPKFFGWPHKEGDFYYARDEEGSFWDYEVSPIYQHSAEEDRCANIGGAIHESDSLPGWNGYFFFLDQCTYEIFIINKTGETVFRSISDSIESPPVVVKNDNFGNILISTYTGEILMLELDSLNLSP
ncbi:MAG: hypothetical protein CL515_01985 [Actinobacteria bacterium]|nr:hypothetical protein [Actinomycetota bacterium]|tara:strand:+ start:51 stop:1601 length:1551 start_codon:yes stop_codon:yes gene_type:complete